jgi:single-strand DNA-binding protein
MADLNIVALVGRLTRDAELKYSNSGVAITKLSLAINSRTKKDDTWQDEAHFFDAVVIGRRGEAIAQYLVKGTQIAVQGELRQDRWEQDGQRRSRVEIFVRDIQLLGGGRSGQDSGGPGSGSYSSGGYASEGGGPPEDRGPSGRNVPAADDFDDDIPF